MGASYDRNVKINRASGFLKIHFDDLLKEGKHLITDVTGDCKKITAKKF